MQATAVTAPSALAFDLTTPPSGGEGVVIRLHLYRGDAPVFSEAIATVEPREAADVLAQCRRFLRGRDVAHVDDGVLPARATAAALPVPAERLAEALRAS